MYKFLFLLITLILMSCASKPSENEKISVTGTRISKEDAEKLDLKPAGTIGDLLKSQMAGIPQVTEAMTCKDLLNELKEKNIEISSITNSEVVAITMDNKQLKYTFSNGGCIE